MAVEQQNGGAAHEEIEKRIKALNKKLKQIEGLKEKGTDQLDAEAQEKVASEAALRKEVKELEAQKKNGKRPAAAAAAAEPPTPVAVEEAPAAPEEPEPVVEEKAPEPELNDEEKEKRAKGIRKKLAQIEKLKEKDFAGLDAEAKAKVESEAELKKDLARLEGKAEPVQAVVSKASPNVATGGAAAAAAAPVGKDPHGGNRAKALEAPPGDLGLLLDDETEKRYKALQKKLRDMCKLHDKEFDALDKLQKEKLTQEPGLIQDIQDINAKAQEALTKRRQARA
mmetsp:Transcript_17435/g.27867  ORF Transcript_17435/g.27867 Transcript_17435/m.27867 type:complete len:282 (+) Transcript_17435:118-963(+)